MRCKTECFFYFFFVLLFAVCSCSNKANTTDYVKNLRGQKVWFEESVTDTLKESKKLILMPDTGDCTTCAMQVYDWYIYKLDLDKHELNCDIIYVLNDSVRLDKSIANLMKRYKLNYIANLSSFYSENKILKDVPFTTFLIDKANKIKLVGSPIDNDKLWKLYKQALQK